MNAADSGNVHLLAPTPLGWRCLIKIIQKIAKTNFYVPPIHPLV
jgi:hypothetical protein